MQMTLQYTSGSKNSLKIETVQSKNTQVWTLEDINSENKFFQNRYKCVRFWRQIYHTSHVRESLEGIKSSKNGGGRIDPFLCQGINKAHRLAATAMFTVC